MFAVIKTGGKQYRVAADDVLKVERVAGEAGDIVEFTSVLAVGSTIGKPLVDGALVAAEIVEQCRGPKVISFKKRRRQNSRRTRGHRQLLSTVRITEILTGGAKPSKKAAKPAAKKDDAPAAKTETKKAAPKKEAKPAPKKEKAASLFERPDGEADDLKKITGVGPVLEKKLHDFGVIQYAQVAAFKKADIDKLDEALSFKGRIERDDWVGQAKTLAKDAGKA